MSSEDHNDSPAATNRDAALERAWREASTERPPSHLDAALVAAAHKAVATGGSQSEAARVRTRQVPWLTRWQPLLAAAGVAGLALVLVPMLPREHEPAPAMQPPESAATSTVESAPGRAATADDVAVAKPVPAPPADSMAERRERAVPVPRRPAPASEVPAPVAAPAPRRAAPAASAGTYARESSDATGDAAATLGQASAEPPDAAAWAARIEALHGAGEFDAAAHELRAFRAADPHADAYLAERLREWARTVEPFPPDPRR